MTEKERNLRVAEALRREHCWDGQSFREGDFVAVLDGHVVAVADNPDEAISALRTAEPDPHRGMVIQVCSRKVDVVR